MKKVIVFIAAFLMANSIEAKIWRINNVAGITADFTTVQAANDNASVQAGDTLHIEPSTVNYGHLTLTKRLTIISIGDFLGSSPNTQYSPLTGRIGSVGISNVSANGSVLHCNLNSNFSLTNGVSNIRVERCRIEGSLTATNSSSLTILNNFLYSINLSTNSSGIVISNNIIEGEITMANSASATITNNVIKATYNSGASMNIYNSIFQNNIINKLNLTSTFTNCTVANNLGPASNSLPAGNGNINSVNMGTVFVNPNGTDDQSFKLQTSGANPAALYGIGGIDCGAFGGSSAFKNALQPAIPSIYKLTAPVTPAGSSMTVTFSTRSNN